MLRAHRIFTPLIFCGVFFGYNILVAADPVTGPIVSSFNTTFTQQCFNPPACTTVRVLVNGTGNATLLGSSTVFIDQVIDQTTGTGTSNATFPTRPSPPSTATNCSPRTAPSCKPASTRR